MSSRLNVGITVIVAVVFLIIGMLISRFLLPGGFLTSQGLPQTLSSNILSLTQPVYNFSGKVEKIDGETLVISQTAAPLLAPSIVGEGNTETPKPKTITYNVKVDSATTITRQAVIPVNAPSSATPSALTPATPPSLSVNDIKAGDYVSVSSTQDLRVLSGNSFTASTVSLAPAVTSIIGQINSIDGNIVTVTGSPVGGFMVFGQGLQQYQISVGNNTAINRQSGTRATRVNLDDLSIGQQITVTTAQGVDQSVVNEATAIEISEGPAIAPPISAPPISSTSAQPSSR